MPFDEVCAGTLRGYYHDVLRRADGSVAWHRGWRRNAIVADCRRLLAGFLRGAPTTTAAIQGLWVGAGDAAWDAAAPPPPTGNETQLVDPNPFLVGGASLDLEYLEGATPAADQTTPTTRLQIVMTLGPNVPPWPDATHASGNLREFGLVAELNGSPSLLNYVTHPVIVKDPLSTLERTIWLVF